MKRKAISMTVLLFFLLNPLSLIAAENEQQTTAPKTAQEKEQYEKGMQERLRKLGKQLDELKAKSTAKSAQAGEKMKGYLTDAEEKQKAAAQKLEEMKYASKDKWKKFSSEINKATKDFERAYERAKSRF
jgi:predicted secreted protein